MRVLKKVANKVGTQRKKRECRQALKVHNMMDYKLMKIMMDHKLINWNQQIYGVDKDTIERVCQYNKLTVRRMDTPRKI